MTPKNTPIVLRTFQFSFSVFLVHFQYLNDRCTRHANTHESGAA